MGPYLDVKTINKTPSQIIDFICHHAKEQNKAALSYLLSTGVCIDMHNGKETAIERLALENNVEAVEFLIREFNASLDYAVKGAARGGHTVLVEDLINRGASLKKAVKGAARGGHTVLVENLIHHGASLDDAVEGAARGGHIVLAADLINRGALLHDRLTAVTLGGYFQNEKNALRLLVLLREPFRTQYEKNALYFLKLLRKIYGTQLVRAAGSELSPKAAAIATLMQERGVSFEQAFAWQQPEVQGLFAFATSTGKLPMDLSALIVTYLELFEPSLDQKKAEDMSAKMPLEIRKAGLIADLRRYYKSSSAFQIFRDKRPIKFETHCCMANSNAVLDAMINKELQSLKKNDPYSELLKKHCSTMKRLGKLSDDQSVVSNTKAEAQSHQNESRLSIEASNKEDFLKELENKLEDELVTKADILRLFEEIKDRHSKYNFIHKQKNPSWDKFRLCFKSKCNADEKEGKFWHTATYQKAVRMLKSAYFLRNNSGDVVAAQAEKEFIDYVVRGNSKIHSKQTSTRRKL